MSTFLRNFQVTVRAQDKKSPVSPGSETVGRRPVDTDVTCPVISSQHHIAKVLQARILRVVEIADLRSDDSSLRGIREIQELVELMRANVAEDTAISVALEKPRRAFERGPGGAL
jgi:hypothetical protein